jgi:hypothetical protein
VRAQGMLVPLLVRTALRCVATLPLLCSRLMLWHPCNKHRADATMTNPLPPHTQQLTAMAASPQLYTASPRNRWYGPRDTRNSSDALGHR